MGFKPLAFSGRRTVNPTYVVRRLIQEIQFYQFQVLISIPTMCKTSSGSVWQLFMSDGDKMVVVLVTTCDFLGFNSFRARICIGPLATKEGCRLSDKDNWKTGVCNDGWNKPWRRPLSCHWSNLVNLVDPGNASIKALSKPHFNWSTFSLRLVWFLVDLLSVF